MNTYVRTYTIYGRIHIKSKECEGILYTYVWDVTSVPTHDLSNHTVVVDTTGNVNKHSTDRLALITAIVRKTNVSKDRCYRKTNN